MIRLYKHKIGICLSGATCHTKLAGLLRQSHLKDLATYKGESEDTSTAVVRDIAKKHGWYLKEKREGMVDHILTTTFDVAEASTLMFFLLVPYWLQMMGQKQGEGIHADIFLGHHVLMFRWMVAIKPWDRKVAWGQITNPEDLYRCILQAVDCPVATGPLANNLHRNSHGQAIDQILHGALDEKYTREVDQSTQLHESTKTSHQ